MRLNELRAMRAPEAAPEDRKQLYMYRVPLSAVGAIWAALIAYGALGLAIGRPPVPHGWPIWEIAIPGIVIAFGIRARLRGLREWAVAAAATIGWGVISVMCVMMVLFVFVWFAERLLEVGQL